mmetsp:Transcript_41479/g.66736  ORF Transcript_41479/g.66736 Transcript_41479/m.66736 type:complete len:202 (-) Transcript_41479:1156-1761(-)
MKGIEFLLFVAKLENGESDHFEGILILFGGQQGGKYIGDRIRVILIYSASKRRQHNGIMLVSHRDIQDLFDSISHGLRQDLLCVVHPLIIRSTMSSNVILCVDRRRRNHTELIGLRQQITIIIAKEQHLRRINGRMRIQHRFAMSPMKLMVLFLKSLQRGIQPTTSRQRLFHVIMPRKHTIWIARRSHIESDRIADLLISD